MTDTKAFCTYCGSLSSVELYETYDIRNKHYHIRKCSDCNAYFLSPQPLLDELMLYYDDSYYSANKSKFSFSIEKFIDIFRKRKAGKVVKYLPENGSVLDIGCGNGRFLNYVSQYGSYRLFGTELDGNSAKRASAIPGIHLKIGSLTENDFLPESIDVVTMYHVFEHLQEPQKMLEIITSILKVNGVFILSMPDIGSWQSRAFKGKWLHLDPPRHLFFFERNDLKKTMMQFGFECVREASISWEQNPFGWVQSILNVWCKKREVLYERLKKNTGYAQEYGVVTIFFQKLFFAFTLPFFAFSDIIESMFRKSATFEMTFRKIRK
jgi:SAM-dependent methyltransferase